jgi:hypothetical protein
LEFLASSWRLCQAPSWIRLRRWSSFGKTDTMRVCSGFYFRFENFWSSFLGGKF